MLQNEGHDLYGEDAPPEHPDSEMHRIKWEELQAQQPPVPVSPMPEPLPADATRAEKRMWIAAMREAATQRVQYRDWEIAALTESHRAQVMHHEVDIAASSSDRINANAALETTNRLEQELRRTAPAELIAAEREAAEKLEKLKNTNPNQRDRNGEPVVCAWLSSLRQRAERLRYRVENPTAFAARDVQEATHTLLSLEPELADLEAAVAAAEAELEQASLAVLNS